MFLGGLGELKHHGGCRWRTVAKVLSMTLVTGMQYGANLPLRSSGSWRVVRSSGLRHREHDGTGRPIHMMSRELELLAGRLCDSPVAPSVVSPAAPIMFLGGGANATGDRHRYPRAFAEVVFWKDAGSCPAHVKTDNASTLGSPQSTEYPPQIWTPDAQTRRKRRLVARRYPVVRHRTRLESEVHSICTRM
jgi:hypothetical protein